MESKHKKDIQYDKSLSSKQNNKPRKKSKSKAEISCYCAYTLKHPMLIIQ